MLLGTRTLLVFVVSVVFLLYFIVLSEVADRERFKRRSDGEKKKIVAFSLMKQIEIESEIFDCGGNISKEKNFEDVDERDRKLWTRLEGSKFFVYSIYRDGRLEPYEYLRIIAMIKGTWNSTLYCQFSSSGHYYITKATATKIWSKSWNRNDHHEYHNPFLISCQIPVKTTPADFFLSKNPCQLDPQKFKVPPLISKIHTKTQKSFTVCVKPLNFDKDISDHLLQWITINKILGATKIEFYIENLPKKTLRNLETISGSSNGSIQLYQHKKINYNHSLDEATYIWQKRRYEIITYNDCLYRNLHSSHFVVPIDVDEIIVPRHVSSWAELLHEVLLSQGEDNFASYTVRNAYYLRQFNAMKTSDEKIFFLKSVIRSDFSDEGESGKSFVSTKNALTVFNHYALKNLRPGVGTNRFLEKEVVQMNHYKSDCDIVILPECAKYLSSPVRVADSVILKYKEVFFKEYVKFLTILKL